MSFIFVIYLIGMVSILKTTSLVGIFGSILFILIILVIRFDPFSDTITKKFNKQTKIGLYSLIFFSIFYIITPSKSTLTLMVGAYYTQELGKRYKGELTELGSLSYKTLKKHLEQLGK